jgi:hypothetical protein
MSSHVDLDPSSEYSSFHVAPGGRPREEPIGAHRLVDRTGCPSGQCHQGSMLLLAKRKRRKGIDKIVEIASRLHLLTEGAFF